MRTKWDDLEDSAVSGVANNIGNCMDVKRNHTLFYVACLLSTADLCIPEGMAIPIEERAAETAVGLITGKGVFHPLNREKLTAFFS